MIGDMTLEQEILDMIPEMLATPDMILEMLVMILDLIDLLIIGMMLDPELLVIRITIILFLLEATILILIVAHEMIIIPQIIKVLDIIIMPIIMALTHPGMERCVMVVEIIFRRVIGIIRPIIITTLLLQAGTVRTQTIIIGQNMIVLFLVPVLSTSIRTIRQDRLLAPIRIQVEIIMTNLLLLMIRGETTIITLE
jgi:hypothetical protein